MTYQGEISQSAELLWISSRQMRTLFRQNLEIFFSLFEEIGKPGLRKLLKSSSILQSAKILFQSRLKFLEAYLGQGKAWTLLLRTETDFIKAFAEKCSNKGKTLILVRTTKGSICGGYASVPWRYSPGKWVEDKEAFLFSVTHRKIFKPNAPMFALYHGNKGFFFGDAFGLCSYI